MRIKYNFVGCSEREIFDVLNYAWNGSCCAEFNVVGLFMSKSISDNLRRKICGLYCDYFSRLVNCPDYTDKYIQFKGFMEVLDFFVEDAGLSPIKSNYIETSSMATILKTFSQILSFCSGSKMEFVFSLYDCKTRYRDGTYINLSQLFDTILDFTTDKINFNKNFTYKQLMPLINFTIHCKDNTITIYKNDKARHMFEYYYKSYYDKRYLFKSNKKLMPDIRYIRTKKKKIVLLEGIDVLKIVFPDDCLVIAFNTKVSDSVLTVEDFKELLVKALEIESLYKGQNLLSIYHLFQFREADRLSIDEFFQLRSLDGDTFVNLSVEKLCWQVDEKLCFADELDYLYKVNTMVKYQSSSEVSLDYVDNFCVGCGNVESFLVYTF